MNAVVFPEWLFENLRSDYQLGGREYIAHLNGKPYLVLPLCVGQNIFCVALSSDSGDDTPQEASFILSYEPLESNAKDECITALAGEGLEIRAFLQENGVASVEVHGVVFPPSGCPSEEMFYLRCRILQQYQRMQEELFEQRAKKKVPRGAW